MEIKGLKEVHALPGLVRLKVAKVKGNPALARRTQQELTQVTGIRQVEAKPGSGSLLIHYDTDLLFSHSLLGNPVGNPGGTLFRDRSSHPGRPSGRRLLVYPR